MAQRIPAQDIGAEQGLLGTILLNPPVIDDVVDLVAVEDFYRESHRSIFRAMLALAERSEPIDLITLETVLRDRGDLERIGGPPYLDRLLIDGSGANAPAHAAIVRDKAWQRRICSVATEIANAGYDPRENVGEWADDAGRRILEACESRSPGGLVPIGRGLEELVNQMAAPDSAGAQNDTLTTGLLDLDRLLGGGLHPSELTILAARPSVGKSALAGQLAITAALERRVVAFFSLEMSLKDLQRRMVCARARLSLEKMRAGYLSAAEISNLKNAATGLNGAPLWIDESSSLSTLEIRARTRKLARTHRLSLVCVDYLQIMRPPAGMRTRTEEVGLFSAQLKALAKEISAPVLAISQLNRLVEGRADPRPILADLRDSGSLEQDADLVLFLWNPQRNQKTPGPPPRKIAVAKQRNGPTGDVAVAWFPDQCRFENSAQGRAFNE